MASPPMIEIDIFDEIKGYLDKINSCKNGTSEDQRRIEKLSKHINAAEDIISRAEKKRDSLQRRNNFLQAKLNELMERKTKAIQYWEEYGFDVKKSSKPDVFEFVYSKLNNQELPEPITVVVKLQDQKLQIESCSPTDVLTNEVIETLNTRLESNCSHPGDEHVDYKLAMLMIRKALIKHPDV